MKALEDIHRPEIVTIDLPIGTDSIIKAAEAELAAGAEADPYKCWGYFPFMARLTIGNGLPHMDRRPLDHNLPASQNFVREVPEVTVQSHTLFFNFMRLSLVKQMPVMDSPYHLDGDAGTGITGKPDRLPESFVWRCVLNLSSEHSRTLSYLTVAPSELELVTKDGYSYCPNDQIEPEMIGNAVIEPRQGDQASGVFFCASRILHTGRDDDNGHFIAAYGK